MASAPTVTIDGRRFSFGKLPARDAVRVELVLAKAVGEPLLAAFAAGMRSKGSGAMDRLKDAMDTAKAEESPAAQGQGMEVAKMLFGMTEKDQATVASVFFRTLTDRLREDELVKTMETVFRSVDCDGQAIDDMDVVFGNGKHREVWVVFARAIKENFGDFFRGGLFASSQESAQK